MASKFTYQASVFQDRLEPWFPLSRLSWVPLLLNRQQNPSSEPRVVRDIRRVTRLCFDSLASESWRQREHVQSRSVRVSRCCVFPNAVCSSPRHSSGFLQKVQEGFESPAGGSVLMFRVWHEDSRDGALIFSQVPCCVWTREAWRCQLGDFKGSEPWIIHPETSSEQRAPVLTLMNNSSGNKHARTLLKSSSSCSASGGKVVTVLLHKIPDKHLPGLSGKSVSFTRKQFEIELIVLFHARASRHRLNVFWENKQTLLRPSSHL